LFSKEESALAACDEEVRIRAIDENNGSENIPSSVPRDKAGDIEITHFTLKSKTVTQYKSKSVFPRSHLYYVAAAFPHQAMAATQPEY